MALGPSLSVGSTFLSVDSTFLHFFYVLRSFTYFLYTGYGVMAQDGSVLQPQFEYSNQ